jgi:hypothetical protein
MHLPARRTLIAVAASIGLVAAGAGIGAYATTSTNVITVCVDKSGKLRVPGKKGCTKQETHLSWNKQGIPGEDGADGADGADGKDGAAGKDGADGADAASFATYLVYGEDTGSNSTVWERAAYCDVGDLPLNHTEGYDGITSQVYVNKAIIAGLGTVEGQKNGWMYEVRARDVSDYPVTVNLIVTCLDTEEPHR